MPLIIAARWPSWLPRGGSLPDAAWRTRHRAVMALLWAHVVAIPLYSLYRGYPLLHTWVDTSPVVIAAILAGFGRFRPAVAASIAALGLMTCSGVIVHLSGGMVEAHFHFFVMIPVIALYEAWAPFGLAVLYVLVHHGVMGTLSPRTVYNNPEAWRHPWLFAGVHAAFFAFACIACVINWWLHERARLAAQAQSQLLATIVDSLEEGLVVVSADAEVLLRNPAGVELLGRDVAGPQAPYDVDDLGFFHTDGTPVVLDELPHARAVAGRPLRDLDMIVRNDQVPDGRVLNFTAIPLPLAEGAAAHDVVVVFRDVTEQHRTEQALTDALATEQEAVERLLELERVKSDFVSTVSHELRTPLTSIMGYVEMLTDGMGGELTPRQLELLGRVGRNGHRLRSLVEDLLKLSQIEASATTIETETTDLRDIVRAARDSVEGLLDGRDLALEVAVPPDALVAEVDPEELERMLVNLLSNAVKFTPDGGRVRVCLADQGDAATLVVEDSGIGIPADELGQLFTRFFRSRLAAEHAIQGTGLGLSIVQAIVDLHEGTIAVESNVDHGTRVTVTLPRRTPQVTQAAPVAEVAEVA